MPHKLGATGLRWKVIVNADMQQFPVKKNVAHDHPRRRRRRRHVHCAVETWAPCVTRQHLPLPMNVQLLYVCDTLTNFKF